MTLGIDLEQFVRDPYGSGIQRVLQQLALYWPADIPAAFVVPVGGRFRLLEPHQAAELLDIPFAPRERDSDLRELVRAFIEAQEGPLLGLGDLLAVHDAWLLPEVSYLPAVLERLEIFQKCMPVSMIGYDALPMTHPANYRFVPGSAGWVSEYFRHLTRVDTVICISDYAADEITGRLRRDLRKTTLVAHPGGDHLPRQSANSAHNPGGKHADAPLRFLRLGTLEARKMPVEILAGFRQAIAGGANAELVFVGRPSASDEAINSAIQGAIDEGLPITWIRDADDDRVRAEIADADVFLSVGTEGYGIPVLEAIRLGTPVIFDGIQPAAELMMGRGALRIDAIAEQQFARLFDDSVLQRIDQLRGECSESDIPTWKAFATAVAESARRA
jgi:glycosyltransferase involved in cell wall biosynthesis